MFYTLVRVCASICDNYIPSHLMVLSLFSAFIYFTNHTFVSFIQLTHTILLQHHISKLSRIHRCTIFSVYVFQPYTTTFHVFKYSFMKHFLTLARVCYFTAVKPLALLEPSTLTVSGYKEKFVCPDFWNVCIVYPYRRSV